MGTIIFISWTVSQLQADARKPELRPGYRDISLKRHQFFSAFSNATSHDVSEHLKVLGVSLCYRTSLHAAPDHPQAVVLASNRLYTG